MAEAWDSPGCGGAGRGGERGRGGGEVRTGRCPQQLRVQDINLVLRDLGHVVEVFLRGWGGRLGRGSGPCRAADVGCRGMPGQQTWRSHGREVEQCWGSQACSSPHPTPPPPLPSCPRSPDLIQGAPSLQPLPTAKPLLGAPATDPKHLSFSVRLEDACALRLPTSQPQVPSSLPSAPSLCTAHRQTQVCPAVQDGQAGQVTRGPGAGSFWSRPRVLTWALSIL